MLDGVQMQLLTVASFAPNSFPGCDIDADEPAPWDEVKTAPNSVEFISPVGDGTLIDDGTIAHRDEPKTAPNRVIDRFRCGGENGEVTVLGAVKMTAPKTDWVPCKTLDPCWLGAIQRKTINGRQYWYWRQAKGKSWSSVYLSADWSKAIAKLAKLQSSLGNPTDRQ